MAKQHTQFDLIKWIKNNYLSVIIIFLVFYLLFAFLAPVLMQAGFTESGKIIYRGYSNLCHQYAYRSWFLFGKQANYPLGTDENTLSIYDVFDIPEDDPQISREIIGDDQTGYKIAICQRDVALYGGLLLFALIFALRKRTIRQLPFLMWILLAIFPIGLDGLTQLAGSFGYLSISYESTPLIRTITGALFGVFSGWLLFPAIENSMHEEG